MIVYRITNEPYKDDISGNGAALYGSRWNSRGTHLLYTSQHISLSILESLVHLRRNEIPPNQYLLHIEFPDEKKIIEISYKKMKKNWTTEIEYTQWLGDQFMQNKEGLILKVPSAIVPEEHNYLLNPKHADFKKVRIVSAKLLDLDKRLFNF
ncbi:MAG: RES family NAD+ phosphorylase [Bacteroidetes bacterium]|nr:RES family NAD+ phosphorylase [Bacteroidota bacterium]